MSVVDVDSVQDEHLERALSGSEKKAEVASLDMFQGPPELTSEMLHILGWLSKLVN